MALTRSTPRAASSAVRPNSWSRILTSGDAGTAVQKARKLIEGDKVDFLLGNVNSALALAMAQVSNEKGVLHIVPGGHTDAITGSSCHWNVFRVCNTTEMEANAVAAALVKDYGKKFYYITPDYAFGHTLESGMVKARASSAASASAAISRPSAPSTSPPTSSRRRRRTRTSSSSWSRATTC